MKTFIEYVEEIKAIRQAMRIPGRELCSVELSPREGRLVIDCDCRASIKDKSSSVYLGHLNQLQPFLVAEVRNALESELARLRAQAGEELKTLALIAAGATP
jgi:hypothetical protein